MIEIKLKEDYGTAKKGDIYIVGLYDVPDYYKGKNKKDDFSWEKGKDRALNNWILTKEII